MAGVMRRWIGRKRKPLGHEIDVYECPRCDHRIVETADSRTFRAPPPMDCSRCGFPDMRTSRYWRMTEEGRNDG